MGRHRDPSVLADELSVRGQRLATFFAWSFGGLMLLGLAVAVAVLGGLR